MDDENVTYVCQWNDLCRLCLRTEQPLRNVFFDEPLLENVREVTNLCVDADDPLPPSVCQVCVDQVNSFVDFRRRCKATESWLRHEAFASATDHKDTKSDKHETMNPTNLLIEPSEYEEELIDDPAPMTDSIENEIELANCIIQSEEVLSMSVSEEESLGANLGAYKCTICDKELSSTCALSNHMRSHTGERPFGCNVCEKFFKTKSNLNEHYRVHNPELRWIKTSSRNLPSLTRVTVTTDQLLTCSQCDELFESSDDLFVHESRHCVDQVDELAAVEYKQEIEEQWPECDRPSSAENTMTLPSVVASSPANGNGTGGSRDCPYCGKSFRSIATLENHKRVHTREKPFACKLCGKPFRTKGNLLEHRRVHDNSLWLMKSDTKLAMDTANQLQADGPSPCRYQCTHCAKPFHTHTAQLNHERVHTREKPFVCSVCEKRFRTKSNLTEHVKGCHDVVRSTATTGRGDDDDDVEVFTFKSRSTAVANDGSAQRRSGAT